MSYTPTTDFLALIRQASGGAKLAEMPGLDYVLAAMERAGIINLYVGQSAPIVNQPTTVWLQPAQPSWTAEGVVFLWNASTAAYETATSALWAALLSGASSVFQAVTGNSAIVGPLTTLVAIQRAAPTATTLTLPPIASRFGKRLQITDWSTGIVGHTITLLPSNGSTIMQRASWVLISTADQLSGVDLLPSADLNGWVIAP